MKKEFKDITQLILTFIIIVIISYITIFDVRGEIRKFVLIIAIFIYFMVSYKKNVFILFFLIPFTADLQFFIFNIPFIALLQSIFLFKCFVKNIFVINKKQLSLLIIIMVLQSFSILLYNTDILNILILLLNLLIFITISTIAKYNKHEIYINSFNAFLFGMVVATIAGFFRTGMLQTLQSWERYSGLWTDPNFFGLLILISISYLLCRISELKRKINLCWIIPLLIILFYSGYRSYSRTFVYAFVLLIGIYLFTNILKYLKNPKRYFGNTIFLIIITIISIFYFFNKYLGDIINRRGLISDQGDDWTNGRLTNQLDLVEQWLKNITTMIFGTGIQNNKILLQNISRYHLISHNTLVDIFIEFGLIGAVCIFLIFVITMFKRKKEFKLIFNLKGSFILLIILYSVTLSMLSSDFLYMMIGLFPSIQLVENTAQNSGG